MGGLGAVDGASSTHAFSFLRTLGPSPRRGREAAMFFCGLGHADLNRRGLKYAHLDCKISSSGSYLSWSLQIFSLNFRRLAAGIGPHSMRLNWACVARKRFGSQ